MNNSQSLEKHIKFNNNVNRAINRILLNEVYKNTINSIYCYVDKEVDSKFYDGFELDHYDMSNIDIFKFIIKGTLSNGAEFILYDGKTENLPLGNFIDEDIIYEELKKEIREASRNKIEGIVSKDEDYAYSSTFLVDGKSINEFLNRLVNRKIKIEILE